MCAIDDCEPWTFYATATPVARKEYRCCECRRIIRVGDKHHKLTGLCDDTWSTSRTCNHCMAMTDLMNEMCGGYPVTRLFEELVEHWREGYASIRFGRLIAQMRHQWHDGRDPIPEGTRELAESLMTAAAA